MLYSYFSKKLQAIVFFPEQKQKIKLHCGKIYLYKQEKRAVQGKKNPKEKQNIGGEERETKRSEGKLAQEVYIYNCIL